MIVWAGMGHRRNDILGLETGRVRGGSDHG